ncbi:MAG: hypothetical protein MK106_10265 [Mariniblastus sp.]|nr:hypothetical protein [Mariniblastus sp.]
MGSHWFDCFAKFCLITAGLLLTLAGCQREPETVADKNRDVDSAPADPMDSSSEQRRFVPGPDVVDETRDPSTQPQAGKPSSGRGTNPSPPVNSGRDRVADSGRQLGRPNQTPQGGGDSSRPDQPEMVGGDSSTSNQPGIETADIGQPAQSPAPEPVDAGRPPSAPKQPGHERSHAPPGTFVGSEIRDIEGRDFDGEDFTLDDYRGKVMMIDFWGDW